MVFFGMGGVEAGVGVGQIPSWVPLFHPHYVCILFLLSVTSAKSFTEHQEEVLHPFYYKGEEKYRERN